MNQDEIRIAAEVERQVLLQQAMREHQSNIQSEMKRYEQEVAHIQGIYELRLTGR